MQKKIIVLALAAAFSAPAFAADTSVYGVVDAAVVNVKGAGTKSDTELVSGILASSRLGVKSSEDIGNGMKASIVLEYGLDTALAADKNGNSIGDARTQKVELAGDFGTVAVGYLSTTSNDFARFDPLGGSAITPLGNLEKGGAFLIGGEGSLKRMPRALAYTSPDMGGVSINAVYSTDTSGSAASVGNIGVAEATAGDKGTAYLVSVDFSEGPLAAAVVYANNTAATATTTPGAKTTEAAIGASYDLGMAKLYASYQTSKVDSASDGNRAMSVSASAPFGASSIVLTYAKASMKASGADKDGSGLTLAYLNQLSKTTRFYAAYSTMSQGSASQAFTVNKNAIKTNINAGAGSSMIAVGVSKKF